MRIIVGGKKTEISTSIFINRANLLGGKKIAKKEPDSDILNLKIDSLIGKFNEVYRQLISGGKDYTPKTVKSRILGIEDTSKVTTLLQLFKSFLKNPNELKGIDFKDRTIKKYVTTEIHLKYFLNKSALNAGFHILIPFNSMIVPVDLSDIAGVISSITSVLNESKATTNIL